MYYRYIKCYFMIYLLNVLTYQNKSIVTYQCPVALYLFKGGL